MEKPVVPVLVSPSRKAGDDLFLTGMSVRRKAAPLREYLPSGWSMVSVPPSGCWPSWVATVFSWAAAPGARSAESEVKVTSDTRVTVMSLPPAWVLVESSSARAQRSIVGAEK